MSELVLSLFPGIGLLDKGFEEHGFCVVRGPDVLWGGDVKEFHPPAGKFEGIIGGPPCQPFSQLAHIVRLNNEREPDKYKLAENLIPEYVRCINESEPDWFLMENVPGVPAEEWPAPPDYHVSSFVLNNRWLPDTTAQNRDRRFWFGFRERMIDLRSFIDYAVFEPHEYEYAVLANGSSKTRPVKLLAEGKARRVTKDLTSTRTLADMAALQGLPDDFLEDAPFTAQGKRKVIGNGVPLPMARAVAQAVRRAMYQ